MTDLESSRGHAMFVISGLERGGAERQLVVVVNGLAARGWRVTLLSYLPFSEVSLRGEVDESSVRLVSLGATGVLGKLAGLARVAALVRRERPDVLVGFMFHGIMAARVAGRLAGVRAVVSAVRSELDERLRERVLGATSWLTDAVTVMSESLESRLVERGVATRPRLVVIPNAVELGRYAVEGSRAEARRTLGVGDDEFVWLAAGRLSPEKDFQGMLRAFASIRKPRARLLIAGDGALRGELELLVKELGQSERVLLLGMRDDMEELYGASDALVLSSEWEGMPNVVLEAMASGKPVVATAVGAVPEMVTDGETGFVVPPGDQTVLARAMEWMMDLSPEKRREMGEAGRKDVRERHSVESVVEGWEELFGRLLEDKAQGRRDLVR